MNVTVLLQKVKLAQKTMGHIIQHIPIQNHVNTKQYVRIIKTRVETNIGMDSLLATAKWFGAVGNGTIIQAHRILRENILTGRMWLVFMQEDRN